MKVFGKDETIYWFEVDSEAGKSFISELKEVAKTAKYRCRKYHAKYILSQEGKKELTVYLPDNFSAYINIRDNENENYGGLVFEAEDKKEIKAKEYAKILDFIKQIINETDFEIDKIIGEMKRIW